MSAVRNAGGDLKNARVLCAGAGSAGLGVCDQIVQGMEECGLTREQAMNQFVVCTSKGTLGAADGTHGDPNYKRHLEDYQRAWINHSVSDGMSIADAVLKFKPNVLLGLSTKANVFDEQVIRNMASVNDRPIIMPMSNPTSKCECTPEDAYRWTNGRAIVATGSPFSPVLLPNGTTVIPSQCNNMYIFPGIGLAASVSGIRHVTDKMLIRAAEACNNTMSEEEIAEGRTFPNLRRIREVSRNVAVAVIEEGLRQDLTTKIGKKELSEGLAHLVERKMYNPNYHPLTSTKAHS